MSSRNDEPEALSCRTRYPLLLVHGIGSRDRERRNYWRRIPGALEERGAAIFYSGHDAMGTIEECAAVISRRVRDIAAETGCGKVNLIAHSKGGLDARRAVRMEGTEELIASLTTISTPHHGLKTVDFVCRIPRPMMKAAAFFVDLSFRLLGDKNPDFYSTYQQFSTRSARRFNEAVPDSDKVYYQSYAAVMKSPLCDIVAAPLYLAIRIFDGDNDGLVPVESARWSGFRGEITGGRALGVSHFHVIGRRNFYGADVRGIYVSIVQDLKRRGF